MEEIITGGTSGRLRIAIFGHTGKRGMIESLASVLRSFAHEPIDFMIEDSVAEYLRAQHESGLPPFVTGTRSELARKANMVIAFGGDGTLLAAARETLAADTPILGVNLGKLGFLADTNAEDTHDVVEAILHGRYRIEERMTLTARMADSNAESHALNDIVVCKSGIARVIEIEASINGEFLATFVADGIIFATPTGSTAYSMATGGPIVVPSSEVIIICPISAHTLTARTVVVPASSRITLKARADEGSVMVMADGQVMSQDTASVELSVTRGVKDVHLVKKFGVSYYHMLRKKLSWAQDHRSGGASAGKQDSSSRPQKDP